MYALRVCMPCGYKLSPAAEGDPPRGNNFRSKSVVLFAEVIYEKRAPEKVAQRVFREEGEKALSWQSPGGALTTFELGNGTWSVPFPDRARSLPRENASTGAKPRAKRTACEICSAATKRRETLLGSVILEARQTSISLAPSLRAPGEIISLQRKKR